MKMELRISSSEIRSNDDGSLTVSGYVNKTNQLSEPLGQRRFREKIEPGAFTRALAKAKKVDFLAEHDRDKILASTANGSLQLREDDQGLYMSATLSNTSWARDYHQLIKDGILQSMSFGFRNAVDSWEKDRTTGENIRTVRDLDLIEVSAVRDPAYTSSSISARGIELVEDVEFKDPAEETKQLRLKLDKLMGKTTNKENRKVEGKPMTTEEMRMRIEKLKGNENRDMNTTANSSSVSPKVVDGQVVDRLESVSNAYAKARKIPFEGEQMVIPVETSLEDAQWVAEGEYSSLPEIDLNVGNFNVLKPKRVGLSMSLSKNLMYSSGVDLSNYVQDLLIERVGVAIENSIIGGDGTNGFFGIAPDTNVPSTNVSAAPTIDQLRLIYNNVHELVLPDSEWYMSRDYFNKVQALKDSTGKYFVKQHSDSQDKRPTLFGFPINITRALAKGDTVSQVPVLFGSIADAYVIGVSKPLNVQRIAGDTKQALRGSVALAADFYGDGAVSNFQAVAKAVVA